MWTYFLYAHVRFTIIGVPRRAGHRMAASSTGTAGWGTLKFISLWEERKVVVIVAGVLVLAIKRNEVRSVLDWITVVFHGMRS